MMTLWCMFRSPLMVGTELTKMDEWTLSLLTNRELLSLLNENCHGTQLVRNDKMAVWKNKNSNTGELYVALFNLSDEESQIGIVLAELDENLDQNRAYRLYEIWDATENESMNGKIEAIVPAHGVKVYKVK